MPARYVSGNNMKEQRPHKTRSVQNSRWKIKLYDPTDDPELAENYLVKLSDKEESQDKEAQEPPEPDRP